MKRHQGGLTLLELLITIALAAILVGIGIPSFTRMLQAAQARQWTGDINSFIGLARTESLRLNADVIIEPSGADWTTEWVLGPDTNGDGSVTGAEIRHRMNGVNGDDFSMVDDDGDVDQLVFDGQGYRTSPGATGGILLKDVTISFQTENCKEKNRRVMKIRPTGGVSTKKEECA